MRVIPKFLLVAASLALVTPCFAQPYPTNPIRIIVPFAPGGLPDIYIKQVSAPLSDLLRQPVIIDSKAGGIEGIWMAATAPPDGYTLLLVSNAQTISESFTSSTRLLSRFVPVAAINRTDLVIVVPASGKTKDLSDLINQAKERPKQLTYGSPGSGTPNHMAGELFKILSGTDLVHVPYRSSVSARGDLLVGNIHVMFDALPLAMDKIQRGELRALAVSGKQRSPSLPDVPTAAEAGLPSYDVSLWVGLMAPVGTSPSVVQKLNTLVRLALERPDLRENWFRWGVAPLAMNPTEFAAFLRQDVEGWASVAKASGAKAY